MIPSPTSHSDSQPLPDSGNADPSSPSAACAGPVVDFYGYSLHPSLSVQPQVGQPVGTVVPGPIPQPPSSISYWSLAFFAFCGILIILFFVLRPLPALISVPLIFLPTGLLLWVWKRDRGMTVLELLIYFYRSAFFWGVLVAMIVETVLTIVFFLICLYDQIPQMLDAIQMGVLKDSSSGFPIRKTFGYWLFLVIIAFIVAAGTEESIKYYYARRIPRVHFDLRSVRGFALYAYSAGLGFGTCEAFFDVLSLAANTPDALLTIFFRALLRALIAPIVHGGCALLQGLSWARIAVLNESIDGWKILAWPILWHGTFDVIAFILPELWANSLVDLVALAIQITVVVIPLVFFVRYRYKKTLDQFGELPPSRHSSSVSISLSPPSAAMRYDQIS